jgi:hypothetical protein
MDLWCCMFLFAAFSNFPMGKAAAMFAWCMWCMLYYVCNIIYNFQCNCNAPIIAWNTCRPIHIGDGFQWRPSNLRTQTRDAADSPPFSAQAWICDNLRTGIFVVRCRSWCDIVWLVDVFIFIFYEN